MNLSDAILDVLRAGPGTGPDLKRRIRMKGEWFWDIEGRFYWLMSEHQDAEFVDVEFPDQLAKTHGLHRHGLGVYSLTERGRQHLGLPTYR